jgi:hypothetical protein
VDCLSEIALVINTSKCSALPSHVTPYEVHFGRKPHWIGAPLIGDQDPEEEGDDDSIDGDNSDEEYPPTEPGDIELTEIEAQILKNNLKVMEQMAKKGAPAKTFPTNTLVTLKIPVKLRLTGEMQRLPVRIIKCIRGRQYALASKHGKLRGLYPGSDLNSIDSSTASILGHEIGVAQSENGQKQVLITLSRAVQLENRRGTVASAQRNGRKGSKAARKVVANAQAQGTKRKRAIDIHGEVDSFNIVSGKRQRTKG